MIVTLCFATWRASPAQKPVSPARAPFDMPRLGIGDFTEPEVMLTMRPNLRAHMPSTVALISMIGVIMLPLTAFCQSSAAPVAEIAVRRAAGVVDQDVGLGAGGERRGAAGLGGDVAGARR